MSSSVSSSLVRLNVLVLTALSLAACPEAEEEEPEDEPNPLEGIYTVTKHEESEPCDAAAVPVDPPFTRFKLAEESFFFSNVLGFFDCTEANLLEDSELDADGCSTAMRLDLIGFENNAVDFASCSCSADGTCSVSGSNGAWTGDDTSVQITVERRVGEVTGVENPDDCDAGALFEANQDDFVCEQALTIEGTRE